MAFQPIEDDNTGGGDRGLKEWGGQAGDFVKHHQKEAKIGAGVAVGAIAVAALAGTAFALYEHHETDTQKNAKKRLHIALHKGTGLQDGDDEIYVVFHQGHVGVKSQTSKVLDPEWNQEFDLGVLDATKDLIVEVHKVQHIKDSCVAKTHINLADLDATGKKFDLQLHPRGSLKVVVSLITE